MSTSPQRLLAFGQNKKKSDESLEIDQEELKECMKDLFPQVEKEEAKVSKEKNTADSTPG